MANYATLKAAIQNVVKTNGNNEITGALLQQSLLTMIDSLGVGYQFIGVADPGTNPGTPDQNVFYIASEPGIYSNFGSLVVSGLSVLKYDGSWTKEEVGLLDTLVGIIDSKINTAFDMLAAWAFKDSGTVLNPVFKDTILFPQTGTNYAGLRLGTASESQEVYMLSPLIDLGEIGSSYVLEFSAGILKTGNNQYPGLMLFDANKEFYIWWVQNAIPRIVSDEITSHAKYARLLFPAQYLTSAYVKRGAEYLFNGANMNTSTIKEYTSLFDSNLIPAAWKPNQRGDFIGWNFALANSAQTAQRSVWDYPIYKYVGTGAPTLSYGISKLVELPKGTTIDVEFSCGVVNTGLMLRLLNPSTRAANYYSANANPRTVSINTSTYTHVQLYFLTANYASCYIKDATNNVVLWQGTN